MADHPLTLAKRVACRSCGAPVVWCWTINQKLQPIDPDPTPNGNIRIEHDRRTDRYHSFVDPVTGTLLADEPRYIDHHATCPDAKSWRRRPKSAAQRTTQPRRNP